LGNWFHSVLQGQNKTKNLMTIAEAQVRLLPLLLLIFATPVLVLAQNGAASERDQTRAAALKKYDRDGDGRLSDAERETMRKEVFEKRRRDGDGGRGRRMFQFPPEIVQKYDRDGDGQLDEEEAKAAQAGIQKMFEQLRKQYDANGNGRLEPEEAEKLQADGAAGKLEGVPRIFFSMGRPRRGPRAGSRLPSQDLLTQMDKDGDGRLNEEELKAVRIEREKQQSGRQQTEEVR
jgi:Ca2+-binding EF-hand superfamily protein